MGVINNYLDEYIREIVSNYRSIICEVIEKNADGGSFDVRPVNNDPIIYDVIIFKSKIVNSEPAIGSYCIVSFLDDMNAYISYMFDFKTNVIDSRETTVVRSDGLIIEQGKNKISVFREGEDFDKLQEYIKEFDDKTGTWGVYCDEMYVDSPKINLTSGNEGTGVLIQSVEDDPFIQISVDTNNMILYKEGIGINSTGLIDIKADKKISNLSGDEGIFISNVGIPSVNVGKLIPIGTPEIPEFKIDTGLVQKGSGIDLKYNGGVNSIMSDLLQIMPILTALDAALLSGANAPIISSLTTRLGQNISLTQ
jgi:hypothetical protein